ncbi:hypothetical protein PPERSA_00294 [Pseudocohnilembus persalinus]|uniref:PEST proteolytic signal-containing nuclear protein n=1 Tax=Pseudocohnilembus persalinus TaxID=266149 RepID=A0A0V0Q8Y4_PSEPJ|nr:hypothetical protein PPERSA_00294 [Pseudocohnilembus persalinus]|eukprot:KRW98706.1 hypothetical protein PPERSA_00294 [Pseudocohnilembus persalinus]
MQVQLKPQQRKNQEDLEEKNRKHMENVFGDEDDEEEEVQLPKNAKKSNNIGRDTITSQGPNSFGKNRKTGFTNDNSFRPWATDIELKHHKLSRPQIEYLNDKIVEDQLKKKEIDMLKQKEEQLAKQKQKELQKIKEKIKEEKNKVKICTLCKRKFENMQKLLIHEEKSELHQNNLKKLQA